MKTQRSFTKTATVTKKKKTHTQPANSSVKITVKASPPLESESDTLGDNQTRDEAKVAITKGAVAELEDRVGDLRDAWETESLFEDLIDELQVGDSVNAKNDPNVCTTHEAIKLRRLLREIGPARFCQHTVDARFYTAKKLLSAFGVRPPAFLEGQPDESYFPMLALAMSRELNKRAKLTRFNAVDDVVSLIAKSRNVICLTGAGISTSLGIPDFRSKGTGLYSQLAHLGLNDPQEVFDIEVFRDDPTIFYSVAKDILPATKQFTPTHKFIALLQEHGKLLTNYSQNIDNVEAHAGIKPEKLVQCHGSFATASCLQCSFQVKGDAIFDDVKSGRIPRCTRCIQNLRAGARSAKRKRSAGSDRRNSRRNGRFGGGGGHNGNGNDSDDSDYDIPQVGVMKPDITFFGETLPDEFTRRLAERDRHLVDLVIVIGTSLKVTPVSEIVSWLPANVPQIYISRTPVHHINFDVDLLGDCDVVVTELCNRLGWDLNHEMAPGPQEIKVELAEGYDSRHVFTVAKPVDGKKVAKG